MSIIFVISVILVISACYTVIVWFALTFFQSSQLILLLSDTQAEHLHKNRIKSCWEILGKILVNASKCCKCCKVSDDKFLRWFRSLVHKYYGKDAFPVFSCTKTVTDKEARKLWKIYGLLHVKEIFVKSKKFFKGYVC